MRLFLISSMMLFGFSVSAAPLESCQPEEQENVFRAKILTSEKQWDQAHDLLRELSATCRKDRAVNLLSAYVETGVCGFNLFHFINSKAFLRYSVLPSTEFASGGPSPEFCGAAVERLAGLNDRSVEEDRLLGSAAVGVLAVTLRQQADRNGDGQIDPEFDPCHEDRVSDKAILAIFAAQDLFLTHGESAARRTDLGDLVATVRGACDQSVRICGLSSGDLSPTVLRSMRAQLAELMDRPACETWSSNGQFRGSL